MKALDTNVLVRFNDRDQVVGIEVLDLSKRTPKLDLRELHYQNV